MSGAEPQVSTLLRATPFPLRGSYVLITQCDHDTQARAETYVLTPGAERPHGIAFSVDQRHRAVIDLEYHGKQWALGELAEALLACQRAQPPGTLLTEFPDLKPTSATLNRQLHTIQEKSHCKEFQAALSRVFLLPTVRKDPVPLYGALHCMACYSGGGLRGGWKTLRAIVLRRARGRCECEGECGTDHGGRCRFHDRSGADRPWADDIGVLRWEEIGVLDVAHLDHDLAHNATYNLQAMCHPCHMGYDGRTHPRYRR